MKKLLMSAAIVLMVLLGLGALIVGAGLYNVAADEAHSPLVYRFLETTRERSIAVRARVLKVPNLEDAASVRRGAGNYDAMCVSCHLAPGKDESEISVGLYPAPPNLTKVTDVEPAEAFWVIKHGIKASGMPAWGKRMEDLYIWDVVAFLTKLPALSAEQYAQEVAASGGHSHGGGEATGHSHAAGEEHEGQSGEDTDEHTDSNPTLDADGKQHVHEAPAGTPVAAVKTLHEALSSGNASEVEELLDPNVLILEGGSVQRSRKEYAGHHLPADLRFMKSVGYKLERQSGDTVGDLAWVVSEARLSGNREDKPVDIVSTDTLVLKKSPAGWKIVHIHWSSRSGKAN